MNIVVDPAFYLVGRLLGQLFVTAANENALVSCCSVPDKWPSLDRVFRGERCKAHRDQNHGVYRSCVVRNGNECLLEVRLQLKVALLDLVDAHRQQDSAGPALHGLVNEPSSHRVQRLRQVNVFKQYLLQNLELAHHHEPHEDPDKVKGAREYRDRPVYVVAQRLSRFRRGKWRWGSDSLLVVFH